MDGFQKSVLTIAVIILVLALVFMGLILSNKSAEQWPPVLSDCPDWWVIDGSGNTSTCTNVKDLGVCQANSGDKHLVMDFNSPIFAGDNGACNKYKWANKCKVSWDGINYGVENPCNR